MIEKFDYPPSQVKRLGWIDAKTRIENIMNAGMVLQMARDEQFDKNFAGQAYRDNHGQIYQDIVVNDEDFDGIPNVPYGDKIDVADALMYTEKIEKQKVAKNKVQRVQKAREALEKTSSKDFVKEQNPTSPNADISV